jgi:predicted metal-dependent HD superfamily phosphohydrolase
VLDLKQNWESLTAPLCSDIGLRRRCFRELQLRYREAQRAYHTLSHIEALLVLWQSQQDQLQDPLSVALAIWYHDCIYNPRKGKNEYYSARLAKKHLGLLGASAVLQERVRALIMATAGHKADPQDSDALFFLDCDLSILGASAEIYKAYQAQIRREYYFVPEFIYRRARQRLIKAWLKRPQLFFTPNLKEQWESQARLNLSAELASAKS